MATRKSAATKKTAAAPASDATAPSAAVTPPADPATADGDTPTVMTLGQISRTDGTPDPHTLEAAWFTDPVNGSKVSVPKDQAEHFKTLGYKPTSR